MINLKNINGNLKIINIEIWEYFHVKKIEQKWTKMNKNEQKFKSFTGLEICKFQIWYNYLNLGGKHKYIVFSHGSKPGQKPKMKATDELFRFLPWLKLVFNLDHTAKINNVSISNNLAKFLISSAWMHQYHKYLKTHMLVIALSLIVQSWFIKDLQV